MERARAYLRAVRRGLEDAPAEDRDRLMRRMTEAVSAYLEEDPEATEADIVRAFGTPEDCAAELLEECDPAQVAAVRRKRRARLYAILAILAVIVLAAAAGWFLRGDEGGSLAEALSHGGHSNHGPGHHG